MALGFSESVFGVRSSNVSSLGLVYGGSAVNFIEFLVNKSLFLFNKLSILLPEIQVLFGVYLSPSFKNVYGL